MEIKSVLLLLVICEAMGVTSERSLFGCRLVHVIGINKVPRSTMKYNAPHFVCVVPLCESCW